MPIHMQDNLISKDNMGIGRIIQVKKPQDQVLDRYIPLLKIEESKITWVIKYVYTFTSYIACLK